MPSRATYDGSLRRPTVIEQRSSGFDLSGSGERLGRLAGVRMIETGVDGLAPMKRPGYGEASFSTMRSGWVSCILRNDDSVSPPG